MSFLILVLFLSSVCLAQDEPEQEVGGFSLVQYGDSGEKKWEMKGKSAELEDNDVKVNEISALSFEQDQVLKLKAKEGSFDRKEGMVHLSENVVLKTTDGTALRTDSLDWDTETRSASTDEAVNIKKADFEVTGKGGALDLEQETAEIMEDVIANIASPETGILRDTGYGIRDTVITCDGPLELNYNTNRATFQNNVEVKDVEGNIFADRIDVYFNPGSKRVKCVVARGNVRIINGENVTYSEKAIYLVDEGRVILPKRPRLVIQNTNGHE
ncbi:MAG: LPS export ABC transporter periplasmic protein LptC [Candidatus Omnitrophica bacterium]|nr:LPS export ABC transporter periplasmic protein LptC [Candidatus Omnitrophota bacterium]